MTANQDESQIYKDLISFLLSDRVDLRRAATDAVLQVRDPDGMAKMVTNGLVKPLAKNMAHPNPAVGVNALRALLQLSSNGTNASTHQCLEDLLQVGGIHRLTEVILSSPTQQQQSATNGTENDSESTWKQRVNLSLALLANLTRMEEGAVALVGKTLPERAVALEALTEEQRQKLPSKPLLELMLSRFLRTDLQQPAPQPSTSNNHSSPEGVEDDPADATPTETLDHELSMQHHDPYQHFAAVLMNSTQTEAGRKFVLRIRRPDSDNKSNKADNGTSVLQAILPQLRSSNPLRRRGIAGTIRNCCLETDSAWWFLNVVKLTKHILYPLAGPEELDLDEKQGLDPDLWLEGPDKVREVDGMTRLYLVEALLLLCASGRKSRETMRLERTYVILKWADMVEEREDVSERINECVQFLRRDEPGTTEGSSDELVHTFLKKPSTSVQISGVSDNYDDVD